MYLIKPQLGGASNADRPPLSLVDEMVYQQVIMDQLDQRLMAVEARCYQLERSAKRRPWYRAWG